MQISRCIVAEIAQLGGVDQVERLQQRWTLAPRTTAVNADVAERGFDRARKPGVVVREVFGREQTAAVFLEFDDPLGNVAGVEGRARRFQSSFPPPLKADGG